LRRKEQPKPMQLTMFELPTVSGEALENQKTEIVEHQRSHYIEMYDLAPRFVLYTSDKTRTGTHLDEIEREFRYRGQTYRLVLEPARINKKNRGSKERARTDLFPGEREQIVEEVVRRLAVAGGRLSLSPGNMVRVTVSLREIYKELERVGRLTSFEDIREAIDTLNKTHVTIQNLDDTREKPLQFHPFLEVAYNKPKGQGWDEQSGTSIVLNSIVTAALRDLDFRQINYDYLMALRDPIARWVYKRISLIPQEQPMVAMTASEIARDSGLAQWSRWRDSVRRITAAVNVLERPGILDRVQEHRETEGSKLVDMTYMMHLSPSFVSEIRRSRKAMEANKRRLDREFEESSDAAHRFIMKSPAQTEQLRLSNLADSLNQETD
jgi:Replication initiator protein A